MIERDGWAAAIGGASIVSAAMMWAAPQLMASTYGLPPGRAVIRSLAVRDALIGAGLLLAESRRAVQMSWRARACSDLLDVVLIVRRGQKSSARPLAQAVRIAGALALAGVAAHRGAR
jgi:hypothetical protein